MAAPTPGKPLVAVSVFLFGKPAWEIEGLEGADVTPELLDRIASCGEELDVRLARAVEIGKKLLGRGWEGVGLVYEIDFYKAATLKECENELSAMGIEPNEVAIREESEGQDAG